ncbi:23S rRNA (cytosine1962-C5)-methyltransferase [Tepidimonas ignava]|uniref:23S rRNA (Cytosine1962-C5)-methyltransferase n=1 Tax=Tepidimonas ignava TaxID=114249 RepID=A0A4R3LFS3_9BURK|nr:class I SAM-dependent methyltransferase [Tepidimonas ignava]TCS98360.1 23S rRNA (cytosine1962-C5)-methyltransferase [Tepidimonas ignava]TSE19522.1 Ribosomal RNA large subunit methyltransferase I [Tepidimonas ignava]
MKTIRLHEGKERSLLRGHPWVFDTAIARGRADLGETVRVEAADGRFLAWGAYAPASRIRVRAWSWDEAERIDAAFFERRLRAAIELRARLGIDSDGVRLVHGESDGLPGLIVDRYADVLVAQFGASGVERHKALLADTLLRLTGLARLYERSDAGVRQREGLPAVTGWLRGQGGTEVTIREHGWRLTLDVASGHKTGYYLDQRDSRRACAEWVRRLGCAEVLNAYCYTGGFTVAALAGGARHVVSVDSSAPALQRAQQHVQLNGLDPTRCTWVDADVNATLRAYLAEGRRFDMIILDPPKLAPSAAHLERAARAYKDVNRLAFKLLNPGGALLTYSCSGAVSVELFQKIVASAAHEAGVRAAILQRHSAAPDHPVALAFPEGEYLKGLLVVRT